MCCDSVYLEQSTKERSGQEQCVQVAQNFAFVQNLCLMQDIVRKTLGDELPDFYNIVLERPKDDPTGYDVLFIDAASKV